MNSEQKKYVIDVLEREISGYSKDYVPERIYLLKEYVRELKDGREDPNKEKIN